MEGTRCLLTWLWVPYSPIAPGLVVLLHCLGLMLRLLAIRNLLYRSISRLTAALLLASGSTIGTLLVLTTLLKQLGSTYRSPSALLYNGIMLTSG